ncbi:hypothetical protein DsansV1_C03g0029141 [Dioscorea sansibarensis]
MLIRGGRRWYKMRQSGKQKKGEAKGNSLQGFTLCTTYTETSKALYVSKDS